MTRAAIAAFVTMVEMTLGAQSPDIVLTTQVEPSTVTVGDPVHVLLTVRHPPEAKVVWPDAVDADPFELRAIVPQEPVLDGARVRSGAELTFAAFDVGELTLPAIEVDVVMPDGGIVTRSSDPAVVTVASVGRDESGDIRDIKGPLAIPFDAFSLMPWLAGLLAVGAAVYGLARYWRRRPAGGRPPIPAPPPRPPHEIAYESLDALHAAGLLERGEVKTFHIRVSDIMRLYVEARFGVEAMEMTSGELITVMRESGLDGVPLADLQQLLDRCDLVKFAKHRPPIDACRDLVPLARQIVDATRPRVAPATSHPEAHVA